MDDLVRRLRYRTVGPPLDVEGARQRAQEGISELKASRERKAAISVALAFLNANFQPWIFEGDEPVAVELAGMLSAFATAQTADTLTRLAAALEGLAWRPYGQSADLCWCRSAMPIEHEHEARCLAARAALREVGRG